MAGRIEPIPLRIAGEPGLAGEEVVAAEGIGDEGRAPVVVLHGLTATRRYVVHGSVALARRGHRMVLYDARGHGESDPAGAAGDYGYGDLAGDLRRVLAERCPGEAPILIGHSMGAHTAAALALSRSAGLAGLVLICPASLGEPILDEAAAYWDRLADGLERGGVEGFLDAYDEDLDPEWRETLLRIARERLSRHRSPEAVADALRAVPRSLPFEGLGELEFLGVPTLVVASRDEADPGHPYAIAEAWAERIPGAELISEDPGSSPLAWQGGRLSRAIADWAERAL